MFLNVTDAFYEKRSVITYSKSNWRAVLKNVLLRSDILMWVLES